MLSEAHSDEGSAVKAPGVAHIQKNPALARPRNKKPAYCRNRAGRREQGIAQKMRPPALPSKRLEAYSHHREINPDGLGYRQAAKDFKPTKGNKAARRFELHRLAVLSS